MPVESLDLGALLLELETRWLSQDPELVAGWGPGVPASEVTAVLSSLGLATPPEVVTWFGWHNGTVTWEPEGGRRRPWPFVGASTWGAPDLKTCLHGYQTLTSRSASIAGEIGCSQAEAGWDPSWFPVSFAGDGRSAGIDCSVSGTGSPIRVVGKADENPERIDAPSLAQVVRWWLDLYESGGYSWDGHAWQISAEESRWLQKTGLV